MTLQSFLNAIGQEVEDADEECFELFSRDIPSANLGFVDSRATTIDVTIHGNDFTIHQSPTLLSSTRAGGTTGAVLWKITPLFAEWISNPTNPFWTWTSSSSSTSDPILNPSSTAVELGCGISGLVALALAPSIGHYIATDQEYVRRLLRANFDENIHHARSTRSSTAVSASSSRGGRSTNQKKRGGNSNSNSNTNTKGTGRDKNRNQDKDNITFTPLDWELDAPSTLKETIETERLPSFSSSTAPDGPDLGFDLLISCDCIYNEALVAPFVRTCADICRLRPTYVPDNPEDESNSSSFLSGPEENRSRRPTVCVIAQQQRSPDVFETWLRETMRYFHVWRVKDEVLGSKLQAGTGYLVHVLVVRGDEQTI
ncbi:Ribosomal protein lysine methyltransferase [Paecilomyces lecythidis]|uniref:Ribosomal protein lysine methyltransferase n=1 Tax=Paecilomyces lecythidis TaxID=3004212 RepID=A0ABR3YCP1_9EURO